ncbi:ACP S-malonyltransferase [Streptomyces cinnamoneus]|uniref:[acyl-carrier-protein] S-malonyltransferase n=1 Tax=Streptomyces cinnamoneus TaxID=53446 RepID=A0A2G1XKQ2_STRCJ|nr:ACP S-malonyltransferase [Streptomyces cinnamoneus]PHQ51834.1 ACP S-malonyltransferase [Streptomyces cinnamoneus]PPT16328.1 ACP S-malonyltransferase [Streptomyces cinnamoneus]
MTTAIVFPGMGPSRFADAGRFMLLNPYARKRLAVADEVLGYRVAERFRESGADYSEFAQVAFLVNCLALADWAADAQGEEPSVCVGPSFGQKAATAYAGSLSYEDTLLMTAAMARCEEEYFREHHQDVVTHSFTRLPADRLAEALSELDERGEWYEFSGYLDDGFHLLSLREGRLDWFKKRISELGGYSMYSMRPPVHAKSFAGLRELVEREVLSRFTVAAPRIPLVADQDGTVLDSAEGVRTMLLDTFDRPIDWPAIVTSLDGLGVKKLLFSGADNLFRRLDRTKRAFEVVALSPKTAVAARR